MEPELKQLITEIDDYYKNVSRYDLSPRLDAGEIRKYLHDNYNFESPMELNVIVSEMSKLMRSGNLQNSHPRYFGLFVPAARMSSIVADALVALYNPQLGSVSHASAAVELEKFTLEFLAKKFGYDPLTSTANFTSGGTEANLSAIVVALTKKFPHYIEKGAFGLKEQPLIYVSEEAHHSFLKIASVTGLGCSAVRIISSDKDLKLDVKRLAKQVKSDRSKGLAPFLVVGTAGTTSAGIIDPLPELADFCKEQDLWFHVDAAWGGAAIMSNRLKKYLSGIERADSITCDAHKWFSVSMSAGMFFCKHPKAVADAFGVSAPYLPEKLANNNEPYGTTLQCSRRFIGLKLFISLAELGSDGYSDMIEKQAELGVMLREKLKDKGWLIVNNTPFPVVCFTHEKIVNRDITAGEILEHICSRGNAWLSKTRLAGGQTVLRACITNFRTTEDDIDILVSELDKVITSQNQRKIT